MRARMTNMLRARMGAGASAAVLGITVLGSALLLSACGSEPPPTTMPGTDPPITMPVPEPPIRVDSDEDTRWVYKEGTVSAYGGSQIVPQLAGGRSPQISPAAPSAQLEGFSTNEGFAGGVTLDSAGFDFAGSAGGTVGFAVGGANDISNFRVNIENGFLPLPTDVTYEGLFYDYLFETGQTEACQQLFCPSYTSAISPAPLTGEDEYFLSVGLNSGLRQSDFARKKLNLVIVLDISGSMDSPFDRYYYDQFVWGPEIEIDEDDEDWSQTKMDAAKEAAIGLLGHLNEDDRFGMVLFHSGAAVAAPLGRASESAVREVEVGIRELTAGGGTNMEAGLRLATEQFEEYLDVDRQEYSNRIVFLTDAQPNTGDISEGGLLGIARSNAEDGLHTTFIGVGVDFNTELVEGITKVQGANYYSVHSPGDFVERLDEQFDFMVTPLVFDLELNLEAEGFEIAAVYGSPEADQSTGELLKVNTLFPSENTDQGTRGGLVLLQLRRLEGAEDGTLRLSTSYRDVSGEAGGSTVDVEFTEVAGEYANSGIRKGILLSRYANLLRSWLVSERGAGDELPIVLPATGEPGFCIPVLTDVVLQPLLSRWERTSVPLTVSDEYREVFEEFGEYFADEMEALGDETLDQEHEILEALASQEA